MRKVFVSSVIEGYGDYRQAAYEAIELMDDRPIMAEHFGARPCSPGDACLTEVGQSDVYLLLMGARYGYKTPDGISVTHAEFREAKATGKPILALIEDVEMEPEQAAFRSEVEDYQTGVFRDTFVGPTEAKEKVIRALRRLEQFRSSATESEFARRLKDAVISVDIGDSWIGHKPILICAWWPQPRRNLDIVALENELDAYFDAACDHGLALKRQGYEIIRGHDHTGLILGEGTLSLFPDGLQLFVANPVVEKEGMLLSSSLVPPSRVRCLAQSAAKLFPGSGAWCHLRLEEMEGKNFAELPENNPSSVSMPIFGEHQASLSEKLIPFTQQSYSQWLETAIGRFGRIFSQRS